MDSTLKNLSVRELKLAVEVADIKGTIEDRINHLTHSTIPQGYNQIFTEYNHLFKSAKSMEAFKRIAFLQWYSVAEPFAFTGLSISDEITSKKNLNILNDLIINQYLDEEFKIMILHYFNISGWYFDSFVDFSILIKQPYSKLNLPFQNRGLMGRYWNSLRT